MKDSAQIFVGVISIILFSGISALISVTNATIAESEQRIIEKIEQLGQRRCE